MIDKLITSTLNILGVPVQRTVYNSKQKPDVYIVSQFINTLPKDYADDDNENAAHTLRVHLYSKSDYTQLLEKTVAALKAAGFTIASIDTEIYEEETGYFHRPITIKIMEELK